MNRLHVPIALRWSDQDAYRHVNNVEILRVLEEARIAAFWRHDEPGVASLPTAVIDSAHDSSTLTLVARHYIDYLRPLAYTRAPVRVEIWIGRLGGADIDVCYEIHAGGPGGFTPTGPPSGAAAYVQALTTIVFVDSATGRPRRIEPTERAAFEPFQSDPIAVRLRATSRATSP